MAEADYQGKVAIITGGARGFGKAFGAALAQRGAHVILADMDGAEAEAAAVEITRARGSAKAAQTDITDETAVTAMIDSAVEAHGGIDILINNAGLHATAYNGSMEEMGLAKLRRLFDVNVMGVMICSMAARPAMRGRTGASIINISSSASYAAPTAYGATKLAVRGLTMTMAREYAADGIRVNAIAPGLIFTDTVRTELAPAMIDAVLKMQILPLQGEERDIVEAMLYLTSSSARFVTGETLRVSGGMALSV